MRKYPRADVVRRRDSLGRSYFVDLVHGGRSRRAAWEADLERRHDERRSWLIQQARADAEERERRREPSPGPPETPSVGGGYVGGGVGEDGVPGDWIDEDGVAWPAEPIEGEDDT